MILCVREQQTAPGPYLMKRKLYQQFITMVAGFYLDVSRCWMEEGLFATDFAMHCQWEHIKVWPCTYHQQKHKTYNTDYMHFTAAQECIHTNKVLHILSYIWRMDKSNYCPFHFILLAETTLSYHIVYHVNSFFKFTVNVQFQECNAEMPKYYVPSNKKLWMHPHVGTYAFIFYLPHIQKHTHTESDREKFTLKYITNLLAYNKFLLPIHT